MRRAVSPSRPSLRRGGSLADLPDGRGFLQPQACLGAFPDDIPLKFGQRPEDVEDQLPVNQHRTGTPLMAGTRT
jgi:hypothetical protein